MANTKFYFSGRFLTLVVASVCYIFPADVCEGQRDSTDQLRTMQSVAIESRSATWAHWGAHPDKYSSCTAHSNRLIPVYSFGISLDDFQDENSPYRNEKRLFELYGQLPSATLDPNAVCLDQTDIYRLQKAALESGKKHIILIIFDGMDWQTTQAAAIYRTRAVTYHEGRGSGLAFQDYRGAPTDFGYMVTSPLINNYKLDVNHQVVQSIDGLAGGYDSQIGGPFPWSVPASYSYLIGQDMAGWHAVTDSASSATSMNSGIKTYNSAINFNDRSEPVKSVARDAQELGFSIGVVTSVPFNHATPAATYCNNVSRDDFQDLARDLLGLPSIANRTPLSGVDVLIGGGWGENKSDKEALKTNLLEQGANFELGNRYLAESDLRSIDIQNGGKYRVAIRSAGIAGDDVLNAAVLLSVKNNERLFGFFGTKRGHLPYATANGDYLPTHGITEFDVYERADVFENPTLADMTRAALAVLETNNSGFWLMIEAGDVDWANHNNNIDDSIGAVFSGDAAFQAVCDWVEANDCWDDTAVIVTSDHGHLLVIDQPEALIPHDQQVP